jgi:hypothetical protein
MDKPEIFIGRALSAEVLYTVSKARISGGILEEVVNIAFSSYSIAIFFRLKGPRW